MNTKIKKNSISLLLVFFSIFNTNHCHAVAVGESYGGGTVFCVKQTPDTKYVTEGSGDYGLIMANEDQANLDSPNHGVTWSTKYTAIPGAQSGDNGAANTDAIIAAFPHDNPDNNAAWLCHNYRDPEGQTGKHLSGWYLPSDRELYKMYRYAIKHNLIGRGCSGSKAGGVQCLVGGYNDEDKTYWSSTGGDGGSSSGPARIGFNSNFLGWYIGGINGYLGVRAVRAFNNSSIQQFNKAELKDARKALEEKDTELADAYKVGNDTNAKLNIATTALVEAYKVGNATVEEAEKNIAKYKAELEDAKKALGERDIELTNAYKAGNATAEEAEKNSALLLNEKNKVIDNLAKSLEILQGYLNGNATTLAEVIEARDAALNALETLKLEQTAAIEVAVNNEHTNCEDACKKDKIQFRSKIREEDGKRCNAKIKEMTTYLDF